MVHKLCAYVNGDISADNQDSLQNQEILLSGHLMTSFIKDRLEALLLSIRGLVRREMEKKKNEKQSLNINMFRNSLKIKSDIGRQVYMMLATGNVKTLSGLGLMQISGFTIVAEKINFWRYLSHFRSVHRYILLLINTL